MIVAPVLEVKCRPNSLIQKFTPKLCPVFSALCLFYLFRKCQRHFIKNSLYQIDDNEEHGKLPFKHIQ